MKEWKGLAMWVEKGGTETKVDEAGVRRADVLSGHGEVQRYGIGGAALRGAEQGEGFHSWETCE